MDNLELEVWKDVEGFKGLYKISSLGRVLSIGNTSSKKDKYLKHWDWGDYPAVALWKIGKARKVYVHRLVAIHFIANPFNHLFVNHKNHIKSDYSIDNLEWCTPADNNLHGKRKARTVKNLRLNILVNKTLLYLEKYNIDRAAFIELIRK